LRITEIFQSIQGEGVHIGEPQIFVRLYDCNLRCRWCDTKYSTGETIGETPECSVEMTIQQVYEEISRYTCKSVCITGGEPLLQREELIKLLHLLHHYNYFVQICTNGTIWDEELFLNVDFISMDMKAPSSGMSSNLQLTKELYRCFAEEAYEVKVVVQDLVDLLFALGSVRPTFDGVLILQPVGGVKMQFLVQEILAHNVENVRVLPQLHKLIWGLERKR
jgi:7-carboxy-7-deazaguanine synthase